MRKTHVLYNLLREKQPNENTQDVYTVYTVRFCHFNPFLGGLFWRNHWPKWSFSLQIPTMQQKSLKNGSTSFHHPFTLIIVFSLLYYYINISISSDCMQFQNSFWSELFMLTGLLFLIHTLCCCFVLFLAFHSFPGATVSLRRQNDKKASTHLQAFHCDIVKGST